MTGKSVLCQEGLPDCHKDVQVAIVWLNLMIEKMNSVIPFSSSSFPRKMNCSLQFWHIMVSKLWSITTRRVQRGHRMANQKHLDLLNQGIYKWNQWRRKHLKIQPDLEGAD